MLGNNGKFSGHGRRPSGKLTVAFDTSTGIISSYGAFQTYYQSNLLSDRTPFEISVIGSVQSFIMVSLGFVTGPLYDAGYFHYLLGGGSVLIVAGTLVQSFCTHFWQFLVVQGFMIGIGSGCLALLSVATTGRWFTTRLPIATGLASLGSGAGGIVIPVLFRTLQPTIGFRSTVHVLAAVAAVTLAVANLVMKTHLPSQPASPQGMGRRRKLLDRDSFRDAPYLLFVMGCFVCFLGMYTPFVYVGKFGADRALVGDDETTSAYLLALLNLASIFGRVLPNFLTPHTGALNMIIFTSVALAISAFCFSAVTTMAGLITVTTVYGFWTGTFFSIQPTIFVRLTENKALVGTRIGFAFLIMAIGLLFGPPVAGALVEGHGYTSAWSWAGGNQLCAAGIIAIARFIKGGPNLKAKL